MLNESGPSEMLDATPNMRIRGKGCPKVRSNMQMEQLQPSSKGRKGRLRRRKSEVTSLRSDRTTGRKRPSHTKLSDEPAFNDAETLQPSSLPSGDGGGDGTAVVENEPMETLDFTSLNPEEDAPDTNSPHASTPVTSPGSPTFDTARSAIHASVESASTTASISSADPAAEKPRHIKIPADTSALRARIAAKIETLRAARKADVEGKPIRTRQELIESRRVKQAERKAHKKELRRQAKLEEERKRDEALASARTSPGRILSPLVGIRDDDGAAANHFAFGRVAFDDGTQMSHDLSYVKDAKKKKGPASKDHKAQLAIVENTRKRLAEMDDDKRKDVEEKETWLAARRRAEGTKIHDDEALLKKAVKRKEKTKKKSEREWKERAQGVEKSIKERQKKREDNINKRKEEKMTKKGKKKGIKVKKGRAGFEGRFGGGGKRK